MFGAVLLLLLLLATAALLELGLRLLVGPLLGHIAEAQGLYVLTDDGYALRGGAHATLTLAGRAAEVQTDGLGLRIDGTAAPAAAERVLLLGDSMVFGLGLGPDQTIAAQLERRLVGAGHAVEVANGGVPGYGTRDVAAAAERLVPALAPRVVVACIYLGNDFEDDVPLGHDLVGGYLMSRPRAAAVRASWQAWFVVHLRTAQFLDRLLLRFAPAMSAQQRIELAATATEEQAFAGWPPRAQRIEGLCCDAEPAPPFVMAALDRLAQSLARLRAACPQSKLLVVVMPSWRQVLRPVWEKSLRDVGLDPGLHRFGASQERVRQAVEAAGLPVLDLTPSLAAAQDLLELYLLPEDGHYSPRGAERVAELLLAPVQAALAR